MEKPGPHPLVPACGPTGMALALALCCAAAPGQDGVSPFDDQRGQEPLRPIDPAVEDEDPLGTSLRVLEPGLHEPGDFSQVYRVPGTDDRLMRIQGGLYAVFPESRYVRTRNGLMPAIPPGTEFYIGRPPFLTGDSLPPAAWDAATAEPPPVARIDPRVTTLLTRDRLSISPLLELDLTRIDDTEGDRPPDSRPEEDARAETTPVLRDRIPRRAEPAREPDARSIFNDAAYRAARLRALLRRAVASAAPPPR